MTRHVNSHIITIHRFGTFLSRAQIASSESFFGNTKESVGGYFEKESSHKIGSGLSLDEEKLLLPDVIDVTPDDRDFRKKVTEFFNDLNTPVPENTGIDLEIGLDKDNSQPVSASNLPINRIDFIRYRHALGHPWVALSKDSGLGNQTKKFYIFDKEAVQGKKNLTDKEKDAAMQIYLKVKETPEVVSQMLTLLGEDVRKFTTKDKVERMQEELRDLADTKAKVFKETYDIGEIEVRAWISAMVTTGVLKQIGKRYIDPENPDSEIGNSIDEAIFFFKDEDQAGIVTALKARLQEANSRPVVSEPRKTVV